MIDAIRNATRPLTLSARRGLALAALAIALLALLPAAPTAHAQFVDESLPPAADLSIATDFQSRTVVFWRFTVRNNIAGNHPATTARIVRVKIVQPNADGVDETEIWTIRDLQPGASVTISREAVASGPHRISAEIIETDPVEPPGFQHNNRTENWAWGSGFTNGDAGVGVSVVGADRFPQAGGATTFTVYAVNQFAHDYDVPGNNYVSRQIDVQVKVTLSQGLAFASTQQAPSGTTFDPDTGIWDVGTIEQTPNLDYKSLPVAVNLTDPPLADLPLEERCLTAEVTRAVPWFALHHHKRANDITTVCLGKDRVLLTGGEVPLFSYRDCVGVTAYPCTSDDTLELLAEVKPNQPGQLDRLDGPGTASRDASIAATWVRPEAITVHVQDPGWTP